METKEADAQGKAAVAKERMDKAAKAKDAENDKAKKEALDVVFKAEDDVFKKWRLRGESAERAAQEEYR